MDVAGLSNYCSYHDRVDLGRDQHHLGRDQWLLSLTGVCGPRTEARRLEMESLLRKTRTTAHTKTVRRKRWGLEPPILTAERKHRPIVDISFFPSCAWDGTGGPA